MHSFQVVAERIAQIFLYFSCGLRTMDTKKVGWLRRIDSRNQPCEAMAILDLKAQKLKES